MGKGENVTQKKEKTSGKKEERFKQGQQVIKVLNEFAERKLPFTTDKPGGKANVDKVVSLLSKGWTVDQLELMVQYKCFEWMNTSSQVYLRPSTLFKGKAEGYIQDAIEAQNNPRFLTAVKKHIEARDKQTSKGKLVPSDVTRQVADQLQNW